MQQLNSAEQIKKLIGLHIKTGNKELFYKYHEELGIEVFQTFIPTKPENSLFLNFQGQLFTHAPYWNNLVKKYDDKSVITWKYMKFVASRIFYHHINKNKLRLVTHLGAGYPGDSIEQKMDRLSENLHYFLKLDADFLILLETEPGSKKGDNFTFNILNEVVSNIKDDRIGICVDSEHMFANGEEPPQDWKNVKLLHFNSIPEKVVFGSHIDRHSSTLLEESTMIEYLIKEYLIQALNKNIPVIFERKTVEMQLQDRNFIIRKVL